MDHAGLRRRLGVALSIAVLGSGLPWLVAVSSAQAVYETVHDFIQSPGRPVGRLLKAPDGRIFGVTAVGGRYGGGSIFAAAQDDAGAWTVSTFYEFRSQGGTSPLAGLAMGPDGALYGTTSQGGAHGGGTVYRLTLGGAFQVLHHFKPTVDGVAPLYEPLALGTDGRFYGTAYAGGLHRRGTIFRVTTAGAFTVLRIFAGVDGAFPTGGLVRGFDGAFYGTTQRGGPSDMGTVFRVTAQGNFTRLHAFSSEHALARPRGGLVQTADGNLFGVAESSGGCVPSLSTICPFGGGGIFRITPNGVFGYAAGFQRADRGPGPPQPGLTKAADGRLYGVNLDFSVFAVDPSSLEPTRLEWLFFGRYVYPPIERLGYQALGGVTELADGSLLVTTSTGGIGGQGAVVRIELPERNAEVIHSFVSAGFGPTGRLTTGADGRLYGTAYLGGNSLCLAQFCGTVFSVSPGHTVVDIFAHNGASPFGDLGQTVAGTLLAANVDIGDFPGTGSPSAAVELTTTGIPVRFLGLYGFTAPIETGDGGIYGVQTREVPQWLSRAEPGSGIVTQLHQFTGPDGLRPYGGLLEGADGSLYGTTATGGAAGFGTVFRFVPGGSLTTLHHFSGPDGAHPLATLMRGGDGLLYGTTHRGGVGAGGGNGVIFRIAPDGTGFTVVHALVSGEGINPVAGLTRGPGEVLYGTAIAGGAGAGSVFAISTAGVFETLHLFAAGQGIAPMGGVTVMPDGSLYGTTVAGGAGNAGVIYKLTLAAAPPQGSPRD